MHPSVQRVSLSLGGHVVAADIHLLADERPPVVFLHGVMTSLDLARFLFTDAERESWIALSLPGHAPGTMAANAPVDPRALADLMEDALAIIIGERPVIVAGWSAGGCAALTLAIHHPRRVRAVASLAGFLDGRAIAGPVAWLMWLARQPLGRPAVIAGLRLAAMWPWLHRTLTNALAAAEQQVPREVATAMHAAFRQHDARSLADMLAALSGARLDEHASGIATPVWIVGGAADTTIPAAATRRLAAAIPMARLTLYPCAGHLFFSEWPKLPADFAAWRASVERA